MHRKKRRYELGGHPMHTEVGKEKRRFSRTAGGGKKVKSAAVQYANVYDPKTKKIQRVKILDVVKNPANPHFVRRRLVTKGCIVRTDLGLARITSRPSQVGVTNAVVVEEKK